MEADTLSGSTKASSRVVAGRLLRDGAPQLEWPSRMRARSRLFVFGKRALIGALVALGAGAVSAGDAVSTGNAVSAVELVCVGDGALASLVVDSSAASAATFRWQPAATATNSTSAMDGYFAHTIPTRGRRPVLFIDDLLIIQSEN